MENKITLRYRIEFWIFCIFLACIPHFLAPENILYGIFALVWLINRGLDKDFGGPWRGFDSLILTWILADILVNIFASLHGRGFAGAFDLLRYSSVLWMVSRTKYSHKQIMVIVIIVLITTLLGIIYAYLKTHGDNANFYFKAIGNNNHTAIFMDLVFGLVLSFLLAFWKNLAWVWRILMILALGFLCFGFLTDASRAGFGALFGIVLILAVVWLWKSPKISLVLTGLLIFGGVITLVTHPLVLQRQIEWQQGLEKTGKEPRECIHHVAWLTFEQSPIIGFGSHSYHLEATPAHVHQWAAIKYQDKPQPCFDYAPHAHNVYFNTLAETGLVGMGSLLLILAGWLLALIKNWPSSKSESLHWALWGAALCAWFTNISIGLVNTTLHHEHALISMMILGLALSYFYNKKHA